MAKLKPLGWQKLTAAVPGTLWADFGLDEGIDVNHSMLASIFAWGSGNAGVGKSKEAADAKLSLTSSSRAMGICVGLHPLRDFTHMWLGQHI